MHSEDTECYAANALLPREIKICGKFVRILRMKQLAYDIISPHCHGIK
jgi:hypothetical protein